MQLREKIAFRSTISYGKCLLGHRIHILRNFSETTKTIYPFTSWVWISTILAGIGASLCNLTSWILVSPIPYHTDGLEANLLTNVTWNWILANFARRAHLKEKLEESALHHWILCSCGKKLPLGAQFHTGNAFWSVESTFWGTSVRQPKPFIPSHLEYVFLYLQESKLHYAI